MKVNGLFRVMFKGGRDGDLPQIKELPSNNGGETRKVLNLNIVDYSTPQDAESPWIKLAVWNRDAEYVASLLEYNLALYVVGDMYYDSYQKEVGSESVKMIVPEIKRVQFVRAVEVKKPVRNEQPVDTPSEVADRAAAAARANSSDEIPF